MKPVGKPKKWLGRPEDDPWNKPDVQRYNNCYSYAVNVDPVKNDKVHGYTVPGKKGNKPIAGTDQGHTVTVQGIQVRAIKYTCDEVRAACIADGFSEAKDKKCAEGCWRVAYYVRDPKDGAYPGGYHFVRENDDGSWSHKDGGNPATTFTYHPPPNEGWGPPPITDPSKDPIGAGYTFCDYLCCCPQTEIAMLAPPPIDPHGATVVTLLGDPAIVASSTLSIEQGAFALELIRLIERHGGRWREGYDASSSLFRIDLPAPDGSRRTYFVGPSAVTEVSLTARTIIDPGGTLFAAARDLMRPG